MKTTLSSGDDGMEMIDFRFLKPKQDYLRQGLCLSLKANII